MEELRASDVVAKKLSKTARWKAKAHKAEKKKKAEDEAAKRQTWAYEDIVRECRVQWDAEERDRVRAKAIAEAQTEVAAEAEAESIADAESTSDEEIDVTAAAMKRMTYSTTATGAISSVTTNHTVPRRGTVGTSFGLRLTSPSNQGPWSALRPTAAMFPPETVQGEDGELEEDDAPRSRTSRTSIHDRLGHPLPLMAQQTALMVLTSLTDKAQVIRWVTAARTVPGDQPPAFMLQWLAWDVQKLLDRCAIADPLTYGRWREMTKSEFVEFVLKLIKTSNDEGVNSMEELFDKETLPIDTNDMTAHRCGAHRVQSTRWRA